MASTDTWNSFIAKLDNSPRGRATQLQHGSAFSFIESITRPVLTNPATKPEQFKDDGEEA